MLRFPLVFVFATLATLVASAPLARSHFLRARDDDVPAQVTYSDPNANWLTPFRLDQCLLGLPQNVSVVSKIDDGAPATSADAEAILAQWLSHSKGLGCINVSVCKFDDTGTKSVDNADDCKEWGGETKSFDDMQRANLHINPDQTMPAGHAGLQTFKSIGVSFITLAKVASNTIHAWMGCRIGEEWSVAAQTATKPEHYRAVFVREPSARIQSGFFQIMSHYLSLLKTSPKVLKDCMGHFPQAAQTGADPHWKIDNGMGDFPEDCKTAWLYDGHGKRHDQPQVALTYGMLSATLQAKLFKAIWDLPCDCRRLFPQDDGTTVTQDDKSWTYESKSLFCDDTDAGQKCEISEQQLANLFVSALADQFVEGNTEFGCANVAFAGEHMHPYSPNIINAGRIDFVMKLEDAMENEQAFEEQLAKLGVNLPELKDPNCTLAAMHSNAEEQSMVDELYAPDTLKNVVAKSTDLQRRICMLYAHDYLCHGYKMPDACDDMDSWAAETMQRLMSGAEAILEVE